VHGVHGKDHREGSRNITTCACKCNCTVSHRYNRSNGCTWSVINGCPLWLNVLPENEQCLSGKARGELGQRMRSVAVPDVTAVRQMLLAV